MIGLRKTKGGATDMRLSVWRFGCAVSSVWALCVFSAGLVNLIWSSYGVEFLKLVDSIYPGYHYGQWGLWGVLVATLYAALDGWIVGVGLAWLYNLYARLGKQKA
jgi:hypothetical protein